MQETKTLKFILIKRFGLALGPLLFMLIYWSAWPADLGPEARAMLASTLWIAAWWITEPIPIPATSLLPILLLPLLGAASLEHTAAAYGNPVIFLFLGGFIIALAMESWGLHKRIALHIIALVGTHQRGMVFGFMLATGLLSMWISNTATTMMMLPIGIAIVVSLTSFNGEGQLDKSNKFGKALMLGIAYAASIGGLGTLIGTPGNAIFAAVVKQLYGQEISFVGWMMLGVPLSVLLLFICWFILVRIFFPLPASSAGGAQQIKEELLALGPLKREEKWIIAIFMLTSLAWISRSFLLNPYFPALDDSMIAIGASLLIFIIPAKSTDYSKGLLSWEAAVRLPWGILLLFGGGLALAAGFKSSGLAEYIGTRMVTIQTMELMVILLIIVATVNFLTEITSNVATATMMLPIMASLAQAIGIHPYGPMLAVCLASSCAFMLPVATPPNAVIFSAGYLQMKDMVRTGFWLNILSIIIITLIIYYLLPFIWNINLGQTPIF